MTPTELGAQMQAAREEAGMARSDVARRLFQHPYTVRRWEQGRQMPNVLVLDAYMRLVGGFIVLGLSTTTDDIAQKVTAP